MKELLAHLASRDLPAVSEALLQTTDPLDRDALLALIGSLPACAGSLQALAALYRRPLSSLQRTRCEEQLAVTLDGLLLLCRQGAVDRAGLLTVLQRIQDVDWIQAKVPSLSSLFAFRRLRSHLPSLLSGSS